jgi:hypothetical protein
MADVQAISIVSETILSLAQRTVHCAIFVPARKTQHQGQELSLDSPKRAEARVSEAPLLGISSPVASERAPRALWDLKEHTNRFRIAL